MDVNALFYYLLFVNILGFLLYGLRMLTAGHAKNHGTDLLLMILALMGGSPGILLFLFFFDRKTTKDNAMLRVWTCCILILQSFSILMLQEMYKSGVSLDCLWFFHEHRGILIYLVIINAVAFSVYGIDKYLALRQGPRIKIVTLLGLAFVGGSLGGMAAMYLFRHKTRKNYFTVGLPLMLLMQIMVLLYIAVASAA